MFTEAERQQQINKAQGEAEALLTVAEARAKGLNIIAKALAVPVGDLFSVEHLRKYYLGIFRSISNVFLVEVSCLHHR